MNNSWKVFNCQWCGSPMAKVSEIVHHCPKCNSILVEEKYEKNNRRPIQTGKGFVRGRKNFYGRRFDNRSQERKSLYSNTNNNIKRGNKE